MEERAWLIWDGECGLCRRCAGWVRSRDRRGALRVAAYQDAPDPPLRPELRRRARDSVMVLAPGGEVLGGGRACVYVLGALGHERAAALLSLPPAAAAVEAAYRVVAANRGALGRLLTLLAR